MEWMGCFYEDKKFGLERDSEMTPQNEEIRV